MRNRTMFVLAVVIASVTLLVGQKEGSKKKGSQQDTAAKGPVLVLKGLDPISLAGGRKEEGNGSLYAVHGNYRYYFASAPHKRTFESNPSAYAVRHEDPVAKLRLNQSLKGEPDIFAVHDGHIYLFASQESLDVFLRNPNQFAAQGREGSGKSEGSGKGSAKK